MIEMRPLPVVSLAESEARMRVITLEATAENGQVRLPSNIHLPDTTKVYIVIPDIAILGKARIASPKLLHREDLALHDGGHRGIA